MFAAYSASGLKKEEDDQKPPPPAPPLVKSDWLANSSFKAVTSRPLATVKSEPQSDSGSSPTDEEAGSKRHKKKKKKDKKSKKKKKHREASPEPEPRKRQRQRSPVAVQVDSRSDLERLLDSEYFQFYGNFTKDQVKKFHFYDDVPGLAPRNAFKVDRYGDKNNLCFDSAYHKLVPSYRVPFDPAERHHFQQKKKTTTAQKLTRKQLRKKMLNDLKENRYFVRIAKIPADSDGKRYGQDADLAQSTLSNKAWLYLQLKNELLGGDGQEPEVDRSSDYVKYLAENGRDVAKWLEFIEYTSRAGGKDQSSMTVNSMGLYQRKVGIFERALKENPGSFRLQIEFMKFKASASELSSNQVDNVEHTESDFLKLLVGQSFSLAPDARDFDQQEYCKSLFEVWFEYLHFQVFSASSAVGYDRIRRTFVKCFEFFLQSKNRAINRQLSKHFFHCRMLRLFELFCTFQARCGYREKAIGAYQALIDFNLCKNASLTAAPGSSKYDSLDFSSRKVLLELYWDIGLPKFGEHLSTGWLSCLDNREGLFQKLELDYQAAESRPMGRDDGGLFEHEQTIVDDKSVRIEFRWLQVERLRSCLNWYPFYPQSYVGESSDDCADPDRLISFDEDISFAVFDLSNLTSRGESTAPGEQVDSLKFKLLCSYLKLLRVVSWDDECLDIKLNNRVENEELLRTCCQDEDYEFASYLNERLLRPSLGSKSAAGFSDGQHDCLFEQILADWSKVSRNNTLIARYHHELLKKSIAHLRNVFDQSARGFETLKFQTYLTVLRWRFEVKMAFLFKKYEKLLANVDAELTWKSCTDTLLGQAKADLSREANRSNFHLWKEYGILKWLLVASKQPAAAAAAGINKETKKVFDTLLATSQSAFRATTQACVDIFSLCVAYAELELGIYYRQFDVSSSSLTHDVDVGLSTVHYQGGLFDLTSEFGKPDAGARKQALVEVLAKHCLSKNEEQAKAKTKTTFSIGISASTKLLITKRDFQREYEQQLKQMSATSRNPADPEPYELAEKKLYLFHKVYSIVLLCLNDLDALTQLNDSLLKEPISSAYHSGLLEFYLSLLNYLHFQEQRLGKLAFKTKLFAIVRSTLLRKSSNSDSFCGRSFLRYLQTTLIRFKLANTKLFCSQLIESNDIDLMMSQICLSTASSLSSILSAASSSFWLSLIATELYKLNKNICTQQEAGTLLSSPVPIHGGLQHQIRRQFQQAVKSNPRSTLLWTSFWNFECQLSGNSSSLANNRLLFVYYQSIRNVPYFQPFYINAIEHLPDKYIEVMSVLSNREIRVRLPIEELNLLLEPLTSKQDEEMDQEDSDAESLGYMIPNELADRDGPSDSDSDSEDSGSEVLSDDVESNVSSPAKMDV